VSFTPYSSCDGACVIWNCLDGDFQWDYALYIVSFEAPSRSAAYPLPPRLLLEESGTKLARDDLRTKARIALYLQNVNFANVF
jgi:hypothetical protein